MAGYGCLTRGVRDSALFLDVVAGARAGDVDAAPDPVRPFLASAEGEPTLRIAYSEKLPPGVLASVDPSASFAWPTRCNLRELGHEVTEREVDYGAQGIPNVVARYLRGVHEEAAGVAHPERLERRTRAMARLGGLVPRSQIEKGEAAEAEYAARVGALFGEFDVLLTPGPTFPRRRSASCRAAARCTPLLNAVAGWVPFYGIWNYTGHPAAAVPAGLSGQGLPRSVQLVGRPADEATLYALAAQLERARPWVDERPPDFS